MLIVIWEFVVREGSETLFERVYGPGGEWTRLFACGEGCLGTDLCRDEKTPRRYITIDRWISPDAYEKFRLAHRARYEALDARHWKLTESETELGRFLVKDGG
jgi:heme-degrading monooxygenase HmoA